VTSPDLAIAVEDLHLARGSARAVDGVSFAVPRGERFGVIGPDGAGKTTLFRILTTLLVPDRGTAVVLGHDVAGAPWAIRPQLGYMPGRFALYPDLSVAENLAFYADVFDTTVADGMSRIAPIWSQLAPFAARRAGALSGGMKQKLALCCALVHRPTLLVLDEPTTGVDAVSRREFWDLLDTLRSDDLTILVSTPYMDEASRCDRVALMQAGRFLAVDTPAATTAGFPLPLLALRASDRLGMLATLRAFPHAVGAWPFGETVHYTDARAGAAPEQVLGELRAWAGAHGIADLDGEAIPAGIEDVFIHRLAERERAA
jgi:ABC-type multidrug transport system ATPase subunit